MTTETTLARVRAANPVPGNPRLDDAALFRRIVAVHAEAPPNGRMPSTGRRGLVAAAFLLLALLATGVAFAIDGIPWWESAPPASPEAAELVAPNVEDDPLPADRSRARTVAQTEDAKLVAAPVGKDGYCLQLVLAEDVGGGCVSQGEDTRSYALPPGQGDPLWVVYGRINDPGAAILDLSAAAGVPLLVPLHYSGFFLAEVPRHRWAMLSSQAGEARILDASGETIRTGCLDWGPSPTGPAAGVSYGFLSNEQPPCRVKIWPWTVELDGATKLVELTLVRPTLLNWISAPRELQQGETIAIWRAPQKDGRDCIVDALASPPPNRAPVPTAAKRVYGANPVNGGDCGTPAALEQTRGGVPIQVDFPGHGSGSTVSWILEGHVDPAARMARVELQPASADVPFAYQNGWFIGQLPDTDSIQKFPLDESYALVGYDSNGQEVARVDLKKEWEAQRNG